MSDESGARYDALQGVLDFGGPQGEGTGQKCPLAMHSKARARVLEEANHWVNTPYHHEGRVLGQGVDCAMILCEVYYAAGLIPHIDPRPYPRDWHLNRDEERYLGWIKKYAIEVPGPLPGDIAVWKFGRGFAHGAIVVDWPVVIHAYLPAGRVVVDDGMRGELMWVGRGERMRRRELQFWSILDELDKGGA